MKLLAIDPGLNSTGYALFEDGKLVMHGTWKPDREREEDKIRQIATELDSLMHQEAVISFCYIETPRSFSYGRSGGQNYESLAKNQRLTGALVLTAHRMANQTYMIHPDEWKGRESKKSTNQTAELIYKVKKASQDEKDAISMGHRMMSKVNQEEEK